MKFAAVIVAAGLSSRMGRFKPLLPVEGKPILQKEVECFLAGGVSTIIVVTGHNAEAVNEALADYGSSVKTVFNPAYREDMFLSVKAGVRALPEDVDAFFFLPADCPAVSIETLEQLKNAFLTTKAQVLVPSCGGHSGHPPLLSLGLREELLSYGGQGGLKGFMSRYSREDVDVDDPEINRDMDTPEEYEKLLATKI